MKKVTVELDWDTIDGIVKQELASMHDNLANDLDNRKNDRGMAIFEHDKDTDIRLIQEHINAMTIVLHYYGEQT